jgi:hypothetical protein
MALRIAFRVLLSSEPLGGVVVLVGGVVVLVGGVVVLVGGVVVPVEVAFRKLYTWSIIIWSVSVAVLSTIEPCPFELAFELLETREAASLLLIRAEGVNRTDPK